MNEKEQCGDRLYLDMTHVCTKPKGHDQHSNGNKSWSHGRGNCTLENCGHMRQLDDIVTLLGMPRGGISVLDFLRTRAPMSAQTSVGTFHEQVKMRAGVLHDALAEMSRPEDEIAAIEAALLHAYDAGKAPMSSGTVSENCDRPPPGWACTRQRGHEGPCAAVPRDVILGSAIVSEPSAGPRDRFNALAEKLVTGLVTYEAVRQALKDVFYEGRREGEGAAKEEWGEAIEEEDTTRAFRVLEILDDQDTRTEKKEYLAAAFAEVRAVAMRELGPRGYDFRWKNGTPKFYEELEKHRKAVESASMGSMETAFILRDAVFFLLALAHQPEPGGV